MDRNETIKRIRTALRRRTGRNWSVTGGRGTAWGWIHIQSPPRRSLEFGYMPDEDQRVLASALGLTDVHHQGVSIPSSGDYREEYVARAEGRKPEKYGTPYWD